MRAWVPGLSCVRQSYMENATKLTDFMNKSQGTTLFSGNQKLTSATKLRLEK